MDSSTAYAVEVSRVGNGGGTDGRRDCVAAPTGAVAPVPLGTIGKFASGELDPRGSSRARRFARQSVVRRLLPGEAVAHCLRTPIPLRSHIDVFHHPEYQSASLGGLQVCGSPWSCPVCAQKIGERRREELERAIKNHRASGGVVLLGTITISHTNADRLSTLLTSFLAAIRRWQSGRAWSRVREQYQLIGMVRSLEVTWGENGWHPHAHFLLFLDRTDVQDDPAWLSEMEDELFGFWQRAAGHHDLSMNRRRGLRLQETFGAVNDYVAKWGREPARRPWGPGAELARAHTKEGRGDRYSMFDLLDEVLETGDIGGMGALFREYVACFKGKSQLRWTPGLRAKLLPEEEDRTDAEVAHSLEETSVLLGRIELQDWRLILRHDARASIVNAAASGEWHQVQEILFDLRAREGDRESDQLLGERCLLDRIRHVADQLSDTGIHLEGAAVPISFEQRWYPSIAERFPLMSDG